MAEFLITRTGQAPPEYVRYQARQLYRCPPSVLAEQQGEFLFEVLHDLTCQQYEIKASKLRQTLG